MKKQIVTTLAVMGLALGAFAQGQIELNIKGFQVAGLSEDTAGNYYGGPLTVQLWGLNTATDPGTAGINALWNSPLAAYASMTGLGFTSLATSHMVTDPGAGTFDAGVLTLPSPFTGVSTVAFAVVAWNNSTAATWNDALAAGAKVGIISFMQKPGNPVASPPDTPPTPTAWDALGQDLVLVAAVPEPSSFALMGLGAAAIMIFRRRK